MIVDSKFQISSKTSQLELALSLSSDILRLQQSLDTFFNSYMWNNLVHNLTTISEVNHFYPLRSTMLILQFLDMH